MLQQRRDWGFVQLFIFFFFGNRSLFFAFQSLWAQYLWIGKTNIEWGSCPTYQVSRSCQKGPKFASLQLILQGNAGANSNHPRAVEKENCVLILRGIKQRKNVFLCPFSQFLLYTLNSLYNDFDCRFIYGISFFDILRKWDIIIIKMKTLIY